MYAQQEVGALPPPNAPDAHDGTYSLQELEGMFTKKHAKLEKSTHSAHQVRVREYQADRRAEQSERDKARSAADKKEVPAVRSAKLPRASKKERRKW